MKNSMKTIGVILLGLSLSTSSMARPTDQGPVHLGPPSKNLPPPDPRLVALASRSLSLTSLDAEMRDILGSFDFDHNGTLDASEGYMLYALIHLLEEYQGRAAGADDPAVAYAMNRIANGGFTGDLNMNSGQFGFLSSAFGDWWHDFTDGAEVVWDAVRSGGRKAQSIVDSGVDAVVSTIFAFGRFLKNAVQSLTRGCTRGWLTLDDTDQCYAYI